ncbi:MAG: WD40-repeat-containing domain protein [Benniella sp.]|nr:MAG: WD40-repeat-containing domain protein [Benniella sp.]
MRKFSYCGVYRESIVYSPKGNELAACNQHENAVMVWSIETGDRLKDLSGHLSQITSIAYSPQGDRIASASIDTTVKLWDVKEGVCLHTFTGHTSIVNCVVYSPSGSQVASSSRDRTVRLWDVETEECTRILDEHKTEVEMVLYSPQGGQVASIEWLQGAYSARLWNLERGGCLPPITDESCVGRDNLFFAFSPRGDQVASAGDAVHLWKAETGDFLRTLDAQGFTTVITAIAYSPQGDLIAAAISHIQGNTVRLWDTETGDCLRILTGHTGYITSVVFSPKGDRIVSSSSDRTIRLWGVGVRISRRTAGGHNVTVHMVKCSPKGDQIASCSNDMTVRLWDVETGVCQHILQDQARCLKYSPQGHQIATCSHDRTVRLWDTHTGGCTHTLIGHSDQVKKVVYSPQGNQLASCSDDQTVRLWDVGSGECLHTLIGHTSPVLDVVYSPNGSQIATCSEDAVRLWDIETGVYNEILSGCSSSSALYSPQGDQIGINCSDEVILWDLQKNEKKGLLDGCTLYAFSPNDNQMATVNVSGNTGLWDASNRKFIGTLAQESWANSVIYSPQGGLVITGSQDRSDKSVRLWHAASGQERAVIQDFHHNVKDIAWIEAPNARYMVAGCDDGVVGVWEVTVEEDRCQVRLHWRTSNRDLEVTGAIIQDVQGLSSLNVQILEESGAVGKPTHRPSKTTIETSVASTSRLEGTSERSVGEAIDPVSHGASVPFSQVPAKATP